MIDNDLTSDFLIYNLLKASTDPLIKQCRIKFIDKSVPASEDNTIYIANVDLEVQKETFNSTEYKALVNIYIKTKQTDYVQSSKFLRTVAKHIKDLIKENVTCKRRHAVCRNITFEYGSKYTLKGLHMIFQLREHEKFGVDPKCITSSDLITTVEVKNND